MAFFNRTSGLVSRNQFTGEPPGMQICARR